MQGCGNTHLLGRTSWGGADPRNPPKRPLTTKGVIPRSPGTSLQGAVILQSNVELTSYEAAASWLLPAFLPSLLPTHVEYKAAPTPRIRAYLPACPEIPNSRGLMRNNSGETSAGKCLHLK